MLQAAPVVAVEPARHGSHYRLQLVPNDPAATVDGTKNVRLYELSPEARALAERIMASAGDRRRQRRRWRRCPQLGGP